MTDDEFVARTGALMVWIDDVWSATVRAVGAVMLLLLQLGVWGPAAFLLAALTLPAVSWVRIERERDRTFPGEPA